MKKSILTFLFLCLLVFSSFAQENGKNLIKISPIGALFGSYTMSYERVINKRSSLQIDANYGNINLLGIKSNTYGAGVGYRFYFGKTMRIPNGFFVSPNLAYSNTSITASTYQDQSLVFSTFNGDLVAGYQWIFKSGFQIDLYAGPQYIFFTDIKYQTTNDNLNLYLGKAYGLSTKLGFTIGYCF